MGPRSRIACLFLPALPLQALLRSQPELLGTAVAVIDAEDKSSGGRAVILAATAAARAKGVHVGQTLVQAQALCSPLTVQAVTEAQQAAASDALYDVASAFSAAIERDQAWVLCEVGDLGQLFESEEALLTALSTHAQTVGLRPNLAIADHKSVALQVARCRSGGVLVPSGREREALSRLPLSALGLVPAQAVLLDKWGLSTVGEFAALPRAQLASRLGLAGQKLHRLACGQDDTPLSVTAPPPQLHEAQQLEDEVDNLEPLAFVLRGLLDRMVARLQSIGQSCGDFTLRLQLQDKSWDERRITVAAPTRQVSTLVELARLQLAAAPPKLSICALEVQTQPTRPRSVQLQLFAPAGPQPERLLTTLARLEALCGAGRVGRPVVPDSFYPGQAEVLPFEEPPPLPYQPPRAVTPLSPGALGLSPGTLPSLPVAAEPGPLPNLLAAHVLRPPRSATVHTQGRMISFVHAEALAGPVRRCAGPYRKRGSGSQRQLRDYYDVELHSGELLRVFHTLDEDRWFVDARYD